MADDTATPYEDRILILRDKAAREGFVIPDEVIDYIADKYGMPQTLKGALINVHSYAERRGLLVDMDIARLVLDGIRPSQVTEEPVVPDAPVEETPTAEQPAEQPVASQAAAATPVEQETLLTEEPAPVFTEASLFDVAPGEAAPAPTIAASQPAIPTSVPDESALEAAMAALLSPLPEPLPQQPMPVVEPAPPHAPVVEPHSAAVTAPEPEPEPVFVPEPTPAPASAFMSTPAKSSPAAAVWFAPVRSTKKRSMVTRAGELLDRAGLGSAIGEGDLVAVKLHFGEEGNTGFVRPVFVREVVKRIKAAGGRPFLTDSNTLYRGQRANAVDHLTCAVHNGFAYATVEAPIIIADGLDGREAVDVPISGFSHFDSVRIGAAAVHADAMVVVTHVKGHEAVGFGGALKNVGMGLGCRSAKQRMHSDFEPHPSAEKCTGCRRCATWCPVHAIEVIDGLAVVDYDLCYGCGECVAACPFGAIAIQWKTTPEAIQEKIVEHAAGALAEKDGKVVYLSFLTDISPDCDCWHFSDAAIVSDIGVLASTDPVAIDQAAYELVTGAPGLPGSLGEGLTPGADKFTHVTGVDGTRIMGYASEHGLGTTRYELKTVE